MNKPHIIRLSEATYELRQACDECYQAKERSPFFFITGAGISNPPIPLARTIIEECKKKGQDHPATKSLDSSKTIDEYSYWFSRAFPQAHHRKRFFKQLISNSYISPANFRLAHLLLNEQPERRLTNLVFTLNFDDFLTRALNTFGKHHIVCDHPATTARVDLDDSDTPQIIHVHGSYHFYDCRNLADEITNAAHLSTTSISMPSLLDSALRYRSPIVIGYSGWDGDIVMSALARRLNGQTLPFNIYWFCYTRKAIEGLPSWLKFHENVRFVAPDEPKPIDNSLHHTHEPSTSLTQPNAKLTQGSKTSETLPAHTVFEALIRAFDLQSPKISQDPLGFFAAQMERNLPQDDMASEAEDIYQFRSVVRKVKVALNANTQHKTEEQPEILLESMREAIRTSRFQDAILLGTQVAKLVPPKQREEFLTLLQSAATGLTEDSPAKLSAYELMSETWSLIERPTEEASLTFATALREKARALYNSGKPSDALTTAEDCIKRFEHHRHPAISKQLLRASAIRCFSLQLLGRTLDSIAAFKKVRETHPEATDPDSENLLIFIAIGLAESLQLENHQQEATALLDSVLEHYKSLPPHLQVTLAQANLAKTQLHARANDLEGALKEIDKFLERFSGNRDPAIAPKIYTARYNKGVHLRDTRKSREALTTFVQLAQDLQISNDPEVKDLRIRCLDNRGALQFGFGELTESLSSFDEVSNLLPDRSEANQRYWSDVHFFRGACLLNLGRPRESIIALEALIALEVFVQQNTPVTAPELRDRMGRGLALLAVAYQRQGELSQAKANCSRAINYIKTNSPEKTQKELLPSLEQMLTELTSGGN